MRAGKDRFRAGLPGPWRRTTYLILLHGYVGAMNHLYLLLKFVAGGLIVAGTTVLTEQINPRYGGLLATAPIILTLALFFVYIDTNADLTRQVAMSSFSFIIPTAIFLATFALLMNRYTFGPSLGGAYGIWILSLLIVNRMLAGGTLAPVL